ncbi:MAG: type II toxin-antitoxin system Phd/YefM family antitoxin [Terriglobales bacterium]
MAQEIAISKFKATCLAILEQVRRTGRPVVVTRFGHPIAQIVPPRGGPVQPQPAGFGSLRDKIRILGDVVSPALDPEDSEAMRGEWEPPEAR